MKKFILFAFAILLICSDGFSQNPLKGLSQNNNLISDFNKLSQQQLYDTGNFFLKKNSIDTALICFNLILYSPANNNDIEQQSRIADALNRLGVIHTILCDYRSAYKYLIDALLLGEKHNISSMQSKVYNNLGNIYAHFHKFDVAKLYYNKALILSQDSVLFASILNNLSVVELKNGRIDSAFYYLNESMLINTKLNHEHLGNNLINLALLFQETKQYDSTFYYYFVSLDLARKNEQIELEAEILYSLSNLFLKINKPDSAVYYVGLSNIIATENNFLNILAENYLTLSKIEESKGSIRSALKYYKRYAELNDSIFNTNIFSDINQLQRLYEVAKTNQQIEQFVIEYTTT